jgi:hypothetical protein
MIVNCFIYDEICTYLTLPQIMQLDNHYAKRHYFLFELGNITSNPWIHFVVGGHTYGITLLAEFDRDGYTPQLMDTAAGCGHLDIVQYFHTHFPKGCTVDAMDTAASNGHIETVEWLHMHRSEGCTIDAMDNAAKNGHLEMVKWLHTHRTEGCSSLAMTDAARNGHLAVVKWLYENRYEGSVKRALDIAAMNGHLELVKWAYMIHVRRCELYSAFYDGFRHERGEPDWFLSQMRIDCSTFPLHFATLKNQTHVIDWLKDQISRMGVDDT